MELPGNPDIHFDRHSAFEALSRLRRASELAIDGLARHSDSALLANVATPDWHASLAEERLMEFVVCRSFFAASFGLFEYSLYRICANHAFIVDPNFVELSQTWKWPKVTKYISKHAASHAVIAGEKDRFDALKTLREKVLHNGGFVRLLDEEEKITSVPDLILKDTGTALGHEVIVTQHALWAAFELFPKWIDDLEVELEKSLPCSP